MTREPQHNDQNSPRAGRNAGSSSQPTEHVSVHRKAGGPTSGVSARSNTAEAWDQLRHTASSATHQINDFVSRTTGSRGERAGTLRQVTDRGRGEAGRGLRALADAAARLADRVDGSAKLPGQHTTAPRVLEQTPSEPAQDARSQ